MGPTGHRRIKRAGPVVGPPRWTAPGGRSPARRPGSDAWRQGRSPRPRRSTHGPSRSASPGRSSPSRCAVIARRWMIHEMEVRGADPTGVGTERGSGRSQARDIDDLRLDLATLQQGIRHRPLPLSGGASQSRKPSTQLRSRRRFAEMASLAASRQETIEGGCHTVRVAGPAADMSMDERALQRLSQSPRSSSRRDGEPHRQCGQAS